MSHCRRSALHPAHLPTQAVAQLTVLVEGPCKDVTSLWSDSNAHVHDAQGTELKSVGGDEHTKDSFTSRTKMVLSSLQTNFEAAAEQGSVKKRRLSSNSPHRSTAEVLLLCKLLSWHILFPTALHSSVLSLAMLAVSQLSCYRC